jgi:hypothetical protein
MSAPGWSAKFAIFYIGVSDRPMAFRSSVSVASDQIAEKPGQVWRILQPGPDVGPMADAAAGRGGKIR